MSNVFFVDFTWKLGGRGHLLLSIFGAVMGSLPEGFRKCPGSASLPVVFSETSVVQHSQLNFLLKVETLPASDVLQAEAWLWHWGPCGVVREHFLCDGAADSSLPVQILLSFLTPGGNRLHSQICEVLDIDLIRQQAEHSAVDIQGLANYVISTMGKICAPVRDEDIRELKATTNIVEMLRLALLLCAFS